jgi:hypothetical protein
VPPEEKIREIEKVQLELAFLVHRLLRRKYRKTPSQSIDQDGVFL